MAKLSAEARFCMLTEPDPAAAVTQLNTLLLLAGLMDRFVTLVVVVFDPARHMATLVNAGHLTPLLYRPGAPKLEDAISTEATGLPLGVMEGYQYLSRQVELRPGDSLLLFTDGITDAMNVQNQPFHLKGIQGAVQDSRAAPVAALTAPELGERIVRAVKQHAMGRGQHDDIALVCIGRVK
jgi:serine phosphatase RsbU (regulator of sigma subunit)